MKTIVRGCLLIMVLVPLLSCASLPEKKTPAPPGESWKDKAAQSEGFSPSSRQEAYRFKRDPERYAVDRSARLPRQPVSLTMASADVGSVLRSLARLAEVNILISEKATGTINVSVDNVPWSEVFTNILKTQGLTYVSEKNLIRVMTDDDLVAELNRQKLRQALENMEPLETRIVSVDFADAADLRQSLLVLLDQAAPETSGEEARALAVEASTITVDPHTNALVIRATKTQMAQILPVIEQLDRPTRQILIQANIVETNQSTARELGAQWDGARGDFTAGMGLPVTGGGFLGYADTHGKFTLSLQLSALQTEGRLKILSSPSITTIDNKKAMIESGKEIPYQTIEDGETSVEYKKAVILLEVTPHVIDENMVKLEISTSKDEIDNSVVVNGNPAIITKKARTEVVLFDGTTTVIGGLNKDKSENNKKGIPWLMDLPLVGHLFKWISDDQELEELLIFITPKILKERPIDRVVEQFGQTDDILADEPLKDEAL
jgi:type IV pilus assembly protein PilQ